MTKTIFSTNLREIKGLKVHCPKCGAYFFVPIKADTPPKECYNCLTPLAWQDINRAIKGIETLQDAAASSRVGDVVIETEG